MSTATEAVAAKTPLGADLATGVEAISYRGNITFTRYVRLVLPLDGFVFWVKADLLSPSALYNAARFNAVRFNAPPSVEVPAQQLTVLGSFHITTDLRQDESETYTVNRCVFSAEQPVQDLNEIGPNELYIAEFQGVRFAFSSRDMFYRQADLYHYAGHAVYSDMASQIIDAVQGFNSRDVVVSNSLPAWLALNSFAPDWPFYPGPSPFELYPSYLTPPNIVPPWGAVHIGEGDTRVLTAQPRFNRLSNDYQLAADRVRVTLYGVRSDQAHDFVHRVEQYSYDTEVFGITNMPAVRDDKRPQPELKTLSQKKVIDFEVSYIQRRIADVARQLILSAIPTYYVGDLVVA